MEFCVSEIETYFDVICEEVCASTQGNTPGNYLKFLQILEQRVERMIIEKKLLCEKTKLHEQTNGISDILATINEMIASNKKRNIYLNEKWQMQDCASASLSMDQSTEKSIKQSVVQSMVQSTKHVIPIVSCSQVPASQSTEQLTNIPILHCSEVHGEVRKRKKNCKASNVEKIQKTLENVQQPFFSKNPLDILSYVCNTQKILKNIDNHKTTDDCPQNIRQYFEQCRNARISCNAGLFHLCFCENFCDVQHNEWVEEKKLRRILGFKTSIEFTHLYKASEATRNDFNPRSSRFCGVERRGRDQQSSVKWRITDRSRAMQNCNFCKKIRAFSHNC